MGINYNDMLEMTIKNIDGRIAEKINEAAEEVYRKIDDEEVNIIEKEPLLKKIQEKKEFIQALFNGNFTENSDIIRRRMAINTSKERDLVDYVSSNLLNKKINKTLQVILETASSPVERVTVSDRKIFLNQLLNPDGKPIRELEKTKDDEIIEK